MRTSNRVERGPVSTPGLGGHTYIMTNREGRQPISATESIVRAFGAQVLYVRIRRPAERPARIACPASAPTSSTPRRSPAPSRPSMAVFTALTRAEAASFLAQFDLGELVDLQGIASGIENTNYF